MKLDTIKDKSNPQSLVNILPAQFADRVKAIPDNVLEMTLKELEKYYSPTEDDEMLRVSFAQEVEKIRRNNRPFNATSVYEGIMSAMAFRNVLTNSFRLAYVIHPFAEYETTLENILNLGLGQMKNIMKRPLVDDEGKFDYKLATLQVTLFEKVSNRVMGAVTQKVDMKSQSLSLSVTKDITNQSKEIPMDLDKQLQELEAQTSNEVRTLSYEQKEEAQEADIISEEDKEEA